MLKVAKTPSDLSGFDLFFVFFFQLNKKSEPKGKINVIKLTIKLLLMVTQLFRSDYSIDTNIKTQNVLKIKWSRIRSTCSFPLRHLIEIDFSCNGYSYGNPYFHILSYLFRIFAEIICH